MNFTIVTSLYNIDREKFDGRKFSDYLNWFEKTLQVNCPMIIFVPGDLVDFVESCRVGKESKIIRQELDQIPYFYMNDRMHSIINDKAFRKKISDVNRIECNYSLYNCIQYSKFKWMLEATKLSNSDYFIWMDAGLSRFFNNMDFSKKFPGKNSTMQIKNQKDKILLQVFMKSYPDLFSAKFLGEEYFLDNRSFVMGGLFGGSKTSIEKLDILTENILRENLIEKNIINNEQITLGYLLKKHPELFCLFINEGIQRNHRSYQIIDVLKH